MNLGMQLQHGCIPIHLPTHYDADGDFFSVNHAPNCSLLELAGLKQVISEPVVKPQIVN